MNEKNMVEESSAASDEGLPLWFQNVVRSMEQMPGLSTRLPVWLPTLIAAWRAGMKGLALSAAVKERLASEEELLWPDELAAEFVLTLHSVYEALPSLHEVAPMASDLLELGHEFVDDNRANELLLEALPRMEALGERMSRKLLEAAFFAPQSADPSARARDLRRLFSHLEGLFDRILHLWIGQYQPARKNS